MIANPRQCAGASTSGRIRPPGVHKINPNPLLLSIAYNSLLPMSKPDKTLFLLDAYALIFRAHFAFSKNPRINSKGLNTSVMFGFTNVLLEILNKRQPSHIGVAFDPPGGTFRHDMYPEYKGNRQETPEDIIVGAPIVRDIVRAFNIPVLEVPKFEADDVIGTLAKKASKAGFEVFMMTPDKDYGQLVEEHVYLYKPAYMGNSVEILGVPEVLEKWDIERIEQVIDMLGLQGDSSDNIPGIPGIGPKTASRLLKDYGSVENLIKHAHELKGKQKERVEEFGEQGILSKQLATIDINVPIDFDADALEYTGPDEEKLKALFDDLEFRTIKERVFGEQAKVSAKSAGAASTESGQLSMFAAAEAVSSQQEAVTGEPAEELPAETIHSTLHDYHLMDTPEKRQSLIKYLKKQKEFCFDTETTSVDAFEAELVGLAFSYYPTEGYYVPVPEDQVEAKAIVAEFKEVLEDQKTVKIAHNIKYDILVLRKYDVEVSGPLFDTMLAHFLVEPDMRHGMDFMAENYLNYKPVSIESLIGKKGSKQGSMRDVEVKEVKEYASEDADITLQLKDKMVAPLKEMGMEQLFYDVEMPLSRVLSEMEYAGVAINTDTLKEMSDDLQGLSDAVQTEIYSLAGEEFNIGSPKQLGIILFEKMKIMDKPKKTKTGQYATGEEILSSLEGEHEIARKILDYREYQKLKSTYVDALPALISPRDGRIHTNYSQSVASTGRLSSLNPNLQNIPIRTEKGREIRKAFVPREEGYTLFSADYSQIELRIMAAFAQDEHMIEAFREGRDIHSTTASRIFKVPLEEVDADMRRKAKTANFGIIYGISAFGLSQRLSIPRKEAADIIDAYFTEFAAVKSYMDRMVNEAREQEYVQTILGRRRYLRDINSRNVTTRGFAERNAINTPIQGSAADMIKVAMIKIQDWLKAEKLKTKMIMQVHDELVFDVYSGEEETVRKHVEEFMKTAIKLDVPMEVGMGFGSNWLEAH